MAIIDQYGRPIEQAALREPQTAKVAGLHREFALHPAKGLTPVRLAQILEQAEQGDLLSQCDLFEDMEERDGHILAEMGKRKRALLTLDWDIVPPRNATAAEKDAAAYARELLQDMPDMEDLILDVADAIGKAYACIELAWRREGREWLIDKAEHRPQRWFRLDRETRTQLRLRDASADGAALTPFGWIVHTHKAKSGYLARAALFRVLAWPYLFKWYSARDMAEFLEIYGLPLRLGTYPTGASPDEKATLLQAVVNIGHAAAGIVPEGMMVEFKEAAKGTHEPFAWWTDWCERTQSKAILGQTLSAEAQSTGLGSGVADLQGEVRRDITESDARQVGGTLTRDVVYPLLTLNGRGPQTLRRCPRFVFDCTEPEDLKLYSEALPPLVGIGVQVPVSYVRDKLKIPAPKDGEAVLGGSSPSPVARGTGGEDESKKSPQGGVDGTAVARAALATQGAGAEDGDVTPIDAIAERLAAEAAPSLDAWLAAIERLVSEAESLPALRARLLAAYADLPEEELAAVMRTALAVADLAGRYDVIAQS